MRSVTSIIVCLLLLSSTCLLAQEKGDEELKVGYGLATSTQFVYDISDIFTTIFTDDIATYSNERTLGVLYVDYDYSVSNFISVGVMVSYEQIRNDVNSNGKKIGKNNCDFYTFAAETAFHYLRNQNFQIYSALGLAYTFGKMKFTSSDATIESTDDKANLVNFNITGVGLRFGNKFGGFAEFGFGYKGIVSAGLSVKM